MPLWGDMRWKESKITIKWKILRGKSMLTSTFDTVNTLQGLRPTGGHVQG